MALFFNKPIIVYCFAIFGFAGVFDKDFEQICVFGSVKFISYFKCPDCGNIHYIYGKSKIDEVAAANDIKTVAKLPMDAKVAELVDSGKAEELDVTALDEIFNAIMG